MFGFALVVVAKLRADNKDAELKLRCLQQNSFVDELLLESASVGKGRQAGYYSAP